MPNLEDTLREIDEHNNLVISAGGQGSGKKSTYEHTSGTPHKFKNNGSSGLCKYCGQRAEDKMHKNYK
ncbi:MAG: hypothetical protein ACRYGG_21670 [Janthinobacterium lividum]